MRCHIFLLLYSLYSPESKYFDLVSFALTLDQLAYRLRGLDILVDLFLWRKQTKHLSTSDFKEAG